jgi:flagellar basal-body rod modification protein FlgD
MSNTINQLITTASPTASKPATSNSQLGEDQFLKLLTTQLQNQNPLNPMDDTQSIAELAQFSGLQAMTELKDAFSNFQSSFSVMQSAGLVGKPVSAQSTDASGNSTTVQGTVKAVQVVNGQPEFTLVDKGGNPVTDSSGQPLVLPTSSILSIGG